MLRQQTNFQLRNVITSSISYKYDLFFRRSCFKIKVLNLFFKQIFVFILRKCDPEEKNENKTNILLKYEIIFELLQILNCYICRQSAMKCLKIDKLELNLQLKKF